MKGRTAALVDVVVVNWNTRRLLEECLASLHPLGQSGLGRVTAVDNGSCDGSQEAVRSGFPWVRLLCPPTNLGFGRAINLGAVGGNAPWIIAANSDIQVPVSAMDSFLAGVTAASPKVGAIAPALLHPDGRPQASVYAFPGIVNASLAALGAHRVSARATDRLKFGSAALPVDEREVDFVMGAFVAIRRVAFEEVGGFDEAQWMYAEDLDLSWRLARTGWQTRYRPTAAVIHVGGASTAVAFEPEDVQVRIKSASYAWLERRRGSVVARLTYTIDLLGATARTYGVAIARKLGLTGPERSPSERWRRIVVLAWRQRANELCRNLPETGQPAASSD